MLVPYLSGTALSFLACQTSQDTISTSFLSQLLRQNLTGLSKCHEAHMTQCPQVGCPASQARHQGPWLFLTSWLTTLSCRFPSFLQEGYSTFRCCFCDPSRKKEGRMKFKRLGWSCCPFYQENNRFSGSSTQETSTCSSLAGTG